MSIAKVVEYVDRKSQRPNSDPFVVKYVLSIFAASAAETVTYPLDLVKTRLQLQGELKKTSSYKGLFKTAAGIVKKEGVMGLWRGIPPALLRHVVYTGVRMGAYEQLREKVLMKNANGKYPLWKAILGGMFSGALGQFLASPADLIKVQLQMEGKRKLEGLPPRVKNVSQAFIKVYGEGGIRGLWKGCVPNSQRAALVNLGDLTAYDTAKRFILENTSLQDNFASHALSSVCAGLVAATFGTPADVIKTRVMNQPTDSNGRGLRYKSSIDCFIRTVKTEGFLSLYKGFIPIWARMAPWSMTFWLTYEKVRGFYGVSSF